MKIVHVINSLGNGGAEAALCRIVMRSSADERHVVSLEGPSWHSARLAEQGIDVVHVGMNSAVDVGPAFLALLRHLRRWNPDVVQTWLCRSNVIGGLAARLVGAPVVWGIHASTFDRRSSLGSRAMVYFSALTAGWLPERIISCSAAAALNHQRIGYPKSKIVLAPNGVDTDTFRSDCSARERLRAELGVDADVFLMGMIARWHPQKDHVTLFEALASLSRQTEVPTPWKCVLVGEGMDGRNRELSRLLTSFAVRDKVILAGARSDIERVMCAIDLNVLSSLTEALPNVVLEAMACGAPCLVTDVGDCAALVGETGWVAPPRSPEQLAKCLAIAMREARQDDSGAWTARKSAARARIVEGFTIATMYSAYARVWSAVSKTPACGAEN